jgi:hypothetical protein
VPGLGLRFALELVFLIALAVGSGVAELSPAAIVAVMAAAWLLVCLLELAVWAEGPRFPSFHRRTVEVEEEEPAAVTEIREPEPTRRRRFWRRRAASGEGA